MAIVTLLTDFGSSDTYVAEMKGVLISGVPNLKLVDLSHEVPAFQIEQGAFQLMRSHYHFPKGTWHLAVVDPGVGTERRGIYVRTKRYHFVGPDNGVLLWAVRACERAEGEKAKFFSLPAVDGASPTFHGRDWFAPFIVSRLKKPGKKLVEIENPQGADFPVPEREGNGLRGRVLAVDRFGNVVTSIPCDATAAEAVVPKHDGRVFTASNYASIPKSKLALIRGSHGFWEIACREESAARRLGLAPGDPLTLFPGREKFRL